MIVDAYICIIASETAWLSVIFICRIHELQEDIIKVKLDLENAQEYIKHLNTQVRNK